MLDILRTFAKNLQAMKRTLLLFVVLVFGVSGLRAQHFEWAKGYSSGQEGNQIIGSVTDSAGNLYILGQFRNAAAWDGGSHLLPIAPYGPVTDVSNVLIAKITPDGTMAWKKVIHCNNGQSSSAEDIRLLGDTAFACLVQFSLSYEGSNYCYYLDTLLTTTSDYPTPNGNMLYASRTAFITFDFEGHVLEQHFLTLTFLDNDGNDIMRNYGALGDWYKNEGRLGLLSFDIDNEGNLYLCRIGGDLVDQTYATWRGNVGGIKYWVDGRVVGISEVRNSPMIWCPQLLKFSPHMDTLRDSRYLVQRCDTNIDYQTDNLYMKLDRDGNPYVIGTWGQSDISSNTIVIDSNQNISISHSSINISVGFLLKLNNTLTPLYVSSFKDSIWGTNNLTSSRVVFNNISFDYDSNLVFVSGFVQKNRDAQSLYTIDGHPLMFENNDAFFFSLNTTDKEFHSYGIIPSTNASNNYGQLNNLFTLNKRVFMQNQFYGGIVFPDRTIQAPGNDPGLCLTIFDYSGHLIEGVDYSTYHPSNRPGPICSRDSILYLINELQSNAIFGNIQLSINGANACIAKYVDTSFMTPYVYTGDTSDVHVAMDDGGAWVSYPNPFRQRVHIQVEGSKLKVENGEVTAWLTDIQGRREEVRLQPNGPNRYVLDLTGRPQATYLLTLVTADGQERTLRLLKQSDMFGE